MAERYDLHLVSDATGETIHSVARACLAQFGAVEPVEHHWSLVRTTGQIDKVLDGISKNPGVVMFTIVNNALRIRLQDGCRSLRVSCIPVLDPTMATLANYFGIESRGESGLQHALNAQYFERIDAMTYAMANDDGQSVWNLKHADLILVGVSRTSKTPTCMYLANRGIKAANIPYVPEVALPEELFELRSADAPLIVGLTNSPERLIQLRRNRLRSLSQQNETDYVRLEIVRREVADARRIFSEYNWPVIDVARRSIEETAAAVMQLMENET